MAPYPCPFPFPSLQVHIALVPVRVRPGVVLVPDQIPMARLEDEREVRWGHCRYSADNQVRDDLAQSDDVGG